MEQQLGILLVHQKLVMNVVVESVIINGVEPLNTTPPINGGDDDAGPIAPSWSKVFQGTVSVKGVALEPTVLKPWTYSFDFHAKVLKVVPIWVRLPNLRLNYWSEDTLSRIGSLVVL
ncbi:hypothetical protein RDABS01_021615 [Bienertia sinuspersici]